MVRPAVLAELLAVIRGEHDQRVGEPPVGGERAQEPLDRGVDPLPAADVGRGAGGAPAGLANLRGGPIGGLRVAVEHDHCRPLGGEPRAARRADAGAAARHERDLAVEARAPVHGQPDPRRRASRRSLTARKLS